MIPFNADIIKTHMLEKHSITIEHYYHKFISSTNQDATNADIITASKASTNLTEPRPQIQITSISTISSTSSIRVRKNHWANGCTYQCVLCKGQKYPEEFICKVCNKDVKHEYTAILNHLRVKHNMTLTNYTQTYIRPAPGIAPPPEPVSSSSSPMVSKPQLPTS